MFGVRVLSIGFDAYLGFYVLLFAQKSPTFDDVVVETLKREQTGQWLSR